MKTASIKLARAVVLFDVDELVPYGHLSPSVFLQKIAERFAFQKMPSLKGEQPQDSGISFSTGVWNETPVDKLTIFKDGILMDTRVSTARSLEVIREALEWAHSEMSIVIGDDIFTQIRYLSTLTFISDAPMLTFSKPLLNVNKTLSKMLHEHLGVEREVRGVRMDFSFDREAFKDPIAPFTVQQLEGHSFDSNRYFSQAPLSTEAHLELLNQFENDILHS